MYKLEFTLKQHTPIIHFQHDQDGATLRATEVKPKLDRFLIETFIKEKIDYSSWINKEQGSALDYKVKISVNNEDTPQYFYFESRIKSEQIDTVKTTIMSALSLPNLTVIAPSPFFANNDKRNNREYDNMVIGVFYNDYIFLEVKTLHENLLNQINHFLPQYFCIENFGNRQSKGFGSFTVFDTNELFFNETLKKHFGFAKKLNFKPRTIGDVFRNIDNVYKTLKNKVPDISQIRDHFLDKGTEWEKHLISKTVAKDEEYDSEFKIMYVRALLGLAELYDYQQLRPKVKVKIKHSKSGNFTIERFQSPVKFKIFEKNIFVVAKNSSTQEIKGEWFDFFVGENISTAIRKQRLQVPESFDIIDFLTNNL